MIRFLILMVMTPSLCFSQGIGSIVYAVRIKNITLCAKNDIFFFNGTISLTKTAEFFNGYINLTRDFLIEKTIISAQKCGDGFYPCEHFMNLILVDKTLHEFISSRNQIWSPYWNSIVPKPRIPLLQKGIYKVTNATFDASAVLNMVPEVAEHTWKFKAEAHERNSNTRLCGLVEFRVLKYTVHPRANRRKTS